MEIPVEFATRTRRWLGKEYEELEQALREEAPVSIRLNPLKPVVSQSRFERVPWSRYGYYLPQRYSFTFDPLFHGGAYYVQEASSMFLEQAIRRFVEKPVRFLDLCAAPGGKTTHALSVLPPGSLVVSNEVIRNRTDILVENVIKWGSAWQAVTRNEPAAFSSLRHYFDVILADVPCSGEGMFRKDPVAVSEWSPAAVRKCALRQQDIVRSVWDALRPGGLLIYSTCTYNTEENEETAGFICRELGAETLSLEMPAEWGIKGPLTGEAAVNRFFPHRARGEGFCLSVFRKPGYEDGSRDRLLRASGREKHRSPGEKGNRIPGEIKSWIKDPEKYGFAEGPSGYMAFPEEFMKDLDVLKQRLNVVHAGTTLGTVKGKNILPGHSLALSELLDRSAFPWVELTPDEAICYLQREAISFGAAVPRGYVLAACGGIPLGWCKNIGSRANNLYPQEWRIRSGYRPEKIVLLSSR